jgi:hypothetical protein
MTDSLTATTTTTVGPTTTTSRMEMEQKNSPCVLHSTDIRTIKNLSHFTLQIIQEIHQLHTLLGSLTCDEEEEFEFEQIEKRRLQTIINKKYAVLEMLDSIRLDFLDQ